MARLVGVRQGVEAGELAEQAIDQGLRHADVAEIAEADAAEDRVEFPGQSGVGGFAVAEDGEIDNGEGIEFDGGAHRKLLAWQGDRLAPGGRAGERCQVQES